MESTKRSRLEAVVTFTHDALVNALARMHDIKGAAWRTRRFIVWTVFACSFIGPVIVVACSSPDEEDEDVGTSRSGVVTSPTSWYEDASTMTNAWNAQTAAGHVEDASTGVSVTQQVTLFEGNFGGTDGVGWTTRIQNDDMSTISQATTSTWPPHDRVAISDFRGPAAIAYVDNPTGSGTVTQGQWLAATQATLTVGDVNYADIALAVSGNGGSSWVSWSFITLIGFSQGFEGSIGAIVLAVDPDPTTYAADAGGGGVAAGNYNNVFLYFTVAYAAGTGPDPDAGVPYLAEYFYLIVVDNNNSPHFLNFGTSGVQPITDVYGNCPSSTSIGCPINCICIDTSFAANTMNLAVVHQNGENGCTASTYLAATWATHNPYGETLDASCPTGTFTQEWRQGILTNAAICAEGEPGCGTWGNYTYDTDTAARACIGDQVNWPKPAIAYDPTDGGQGFAMAYSKYCSGESCTPAGNRVYYEQVIGVGCPGADGGFIEQTGPVITPCQIATGYPNASAPCVCNSGSGCGTSPQSCELDQILPAMAYDSNGSGANNYPLSAIWYDNTRNCSTQGISSFQNVLGAAGGDASAGAGTIENLYAAGFSPIVVLAPELDASASSNKEIGLSPQNAAVHFFSANNGKANVYNSQYGSN
jgi:hypothetical protein